METAAFLGDSFSTTFPDAPNGDGNMYLQPFPLVNFGGRFSRFMKVNPYIRSIWVCNKGVYTFCFWEIKTPAY